MDQSPFQRIGSTISQTWIRIPIKAIAVYVVLYFELSTKITIVFAISIIASEIYEYFGERYVNHNPSKRDAVALIIGVGNVLLSLLLLVITGLIDTEVLLILYPVIISVAINTGLVGGLVAGLISAFFYVLAIRPELTAFEPMFRAVMFATVGLLAGILAEANLQNQAENQKLHANFGKSGETVNLKQDFLSIASHYLRTPLTVLKGYFEQLNATSQTSEQKPIIEGIGTNIKRIDLVNETILKVIDFEANNTELTLTDVNINDLCKEIVDTFSILASKRGVTLNYVHTSEEKPIIKIDGAKIRTALSNLIDNAIIFSPEQSTVELRLESLEQQVVFIITDHGKGIAPDELALLFEPFLKLNVLEMTSEGMGLGLFFTKRIINLHGGTISVESKVNEGTVFTIVLPKETTQTFLEEIG